MEEPHDIYFASNTNYSQSSFQYPKDFAYPKKEVPDSNPL